MTGSGGLRGQEDGIGLGGSEEGGIDHLGGFVGGFGGGGLGGRGGFDVESEGILGGSDDKVLIVDGANVNGTFLECGESLFTVAQLLVEFVLCSGTRHGARVAGFQRRLHGEGDTGLNVEAHE